MKNLESGNLSCTLIGEFLLDLINEFREENDKIVKATESKNIEQKSKTIEKFIQEFRKAARESKYKE